MGRRERIPKKKKNKLANPFDDPCDLLSFSIHTMSSPDVSCMLTVSRLTSTSAVHHTAQSKQVTLRVGSSRNLNTEHLPPASQLAVRVPKKAFRSSQTAPYRVYRTTLEGRRNPLTQRQEQHENDIQGCVITLIFTSVFAE